LRDNNVGTTLEKAACESGATRAIEFVGGKSFELDSNNGVINQAAFVEYAKKLKHP